MVGAMRYRVEVRANNQSLSLVLEVAISTMAQAMCYKFGAFSDDASQKSSP